jgi:alpha-beta hydrolase superfamily lysophospholipase
MSESTQAPFTMRDGLNVATCDWPLHASVKPRGVVLIVHGLGEHIWRYDPLAQRLNEWGFFVRGYDQRGHGESGGARGVMPDDNALLDDLAEMVDDTRRHVAHPSACPLLLLGHSMGGLVAATFVQRAMAPIDFLVLSSPAFDAGMSSWQKRLVRVLYRWAPNLAVSSGLDAQAISHDAAVVQAYERDHLVHDRISARLAHFIDANGPQVVASAPVWKVPTLLMFAGDDRLVNPEGSRAFAAVAPHDVVTSQCLEGQFHEIFNEEDPSRAFSGLKAWLNERVPA